MQIGDNTFLISRNGLGTLARADQIRPKSETLETNDDEDGKGVNFNDGVINSCHNSGHSWPLL